MKGTCEHCIPLNSALLVSSRDFGGRIFLVKGIWSIHTSNRDSLVIGLRGIAARYPHHLHSIGSQKIFDKFLLGFPKGCRGTYLLMRLSLFYLLVATRMSRNTTSPKGRLFFSTTTLHLWRREIISYKVTNSLASRLMNF